MAGEGMYLREQKPIDYQETVKVFARNAPSQAHLHLRPRLGQHFGHFYARYFPEFAKGETPRVRFRFREVPPGSLIRAAVTAISSFALIWVVAYVSAFRDPNTDAPVLLLAFPAIAATWLGFESSSRNLLEGRLAARISLIVTVMTSLAASALFVIDKATPDAELVWAGGVSFLWIEEVKWSILLAVSFANAIYLAYLYWLSTYEFYYFLTRPSGEGIERVA